MIPRRHTTGTFPQADFSTHTQTDDKVPLPVYTILAFLRSSWLARQPLSDEGDRRTAGLSNNLEGCSRLAVPPGP